MYQEFSRVATPQDNSYVEALNSNLQREVIDRFELLDPQKAQQMITRYYRWYNENDGTGPCRIEHRSRGEMIILVRSL